MAFGGKRTLLMSMTLLAAVGMAALPGGTLAKDGDIIRTGSCTGNTSWKLKLSPENGRIEVELEVDQNRNGQTWNVRLKRNGNVFWKGKVTANGAGSDFIVARARNVKSGEVCRGTATFA